MINKQDSSIPTPWDGDTSVTSNVAKAELLNSFFYKCLCKSSLLLSNLVPLDLESCPVSILCTEEQVLKMLCSLEISKSTGLDGVSTYMLRQTALFLVTGSFSSEWKCARIILIFCLNDSSLPENYRPISILPIVSTPLEEQIHSLISKHL